MDLIKSASPLTIKSYRLDLSQAFGREIITQSLDEEALLNHSRKALSAWGGLSLASRNRKAATLKSFFSWAFEESLTERDLSIQITCPKVPKKIPHFISVDEAVVVLKNLTAEKSLLKDRVLFLLLYGGGLRVSEACNLKWSDIAFPQRQLRVIGKGAKERVVVLPPLVFEALQVWHKELGDETFVFGMEALNQRTAYEMVRQSGIRAGLLLPLHPHALRHSFATHLLSSGANLRTLQELLGHESLQATEKYTHLGIDQLARTMERVHPLGNKGK
jgi:integrase/recombinase XerC/integrase/recombinase XerD